MKLTIKLITLNKCNIKNNKQNINGIDEILFKDLRTIKKEIHKDIPL